MKVKELIAELQKHDPEALVVTDCYEMGINEFRVVRPLVVYKNENRPFWYGRYEAIKPGSYTVKDAQPVSAVYLPRLDDEDAINE
jgi:hypothetical protein